MANPLFQQQTQSKPYQQEDMQRLYGQFQQDPNAFLARVGLNIPTSFAGDPRAMLQYLADNGKVPQFLQGRVNAALGRK